MANLESLRELYAFMRENKVLYARCGELELRLEAPPAPPASASVEPESQDDPDRRALSELLYSTEAEAGAFLELMRRSEAA